LITKTIIDELGAFLPGFEVIEVSPVFLAIADATPIDYDLLAAQFLELAKKHFKSNMILKVGQCSQSTLVLAIGTDRIAIEKLVDGFLTDSPSQFLH
jgi:hypothetical protein